MRELSDGEQKGAFLAKGSCMCVLDGIPEKRGKRTLESISWRRTIMNRT